MTHQPPTGSAAAAREAALGRLGSELFDVLVVGGGITGAGIARDAALRGLRVALVERRDYGSGTSSRSSKLVHGGLRYLEHYEIGQVFESVRERARQQRLNPNLVRPLEFIMPVYRGGKHGLVKLDAGLWLYDLMSLGRATPLHTRLKRRRTLEAVPDLAPDDLVGSIHFFDSWTDDARLTLANVLDAQRQGAVTVNYLAFEAPRIEHDVVGGARLVDQQTGASLTARCRQLVFAGGPWTDRLTLASGGGGRMLRLSKGVHIIVAAERLPLETAVVMNAVADGRIVFAIPFENVSYIGTTDTDFDGDLDAVRTSADDIAYLLDTANHHFPTAALTQHDVRSTFAGVRPLVRDDSDSASRTSRRHQVVRDPRGIITVAGGKLTTYRLMAADAVDAVADALERSSDASPGSCRTHKRRLDPDLPAAPGSDASPLARLLWRTHGSAMQAVLERIDQVPGEAERVTDDLTYVMAQVSYAVLGEQAETLEDVLVRRLQVFYRAADQGLGCARRVAAHMAALTGRPAAWVDDQVAAYRRVVELSRRGVDALNTRSSTDEFERIRVSQRQP